MNYRRTNQNKKILKTFKDYLFPIVIVFIILIFVLNYIFSWENNTPVSTDNTPVSVNIESPDTESYIVYSWWNKTKLEWETSLYKSEKVQVVNWNVDLKWDGMNLVLNKLWELTYNEDGSYTLYSSDLWVNTSSGINLEMRYAKVLTKQQAVFSASQNEVASTVYVLSWMVEVRNLAWKTTTLQKWEKLVIMRASANDEASDLSLSKEQIDDYIKKEDWFLKNNWESFLQTVETTSTWTLSQSWTTSSGSYTWNSGFAYISFNWIYDEAQVSSDVLNISWNVLDDSVSKIEINSQLATIDTQAKTFSLKDFKVSSRVNDLIYRVYDSSSNLLYKWVITVYYSKWTTTSSTINNTSSLAQVENYPITTSPLYQIISPKQNPYTTTENNVRIEWNVPARTVEKIIVNDFQLQKFPAYWNYWYYFANAEFGNLKDWVNIYKIQYYWAEWKLLYENNFTIIKQPAVVETPKPEVTQEAQTETTQETWTWEVQ